MDTNENIAGLPICLPYKQLKFLGLSIQYNFVVNIWENSVGIIKKTYQAYSTIKGTECFNNIIIIKVTSRLT